MPEFYKRVTATQFRLSSEEKDNIRKGTAVSFEGQAVKFIGGDRFLVLIPVADRLLPLGDNGWVVRNPEIELYSDTDFKAKFIAKERPPEPKEPITNNQ